MFCNTTQIQATKTATTISSQNAKQSPVGNSLERAMGNNNLKTCANKCSEKNIQCKPVSSAAHALQIASINDPGEREADIVADRVVSAALPRNINSEQNVPSRSKPFVQTRMRELEGYGTAPDDALRNYFEPRFGEDFSQVKIHRGTRASELAQHLQARAFTSGNHIVFGANEYSMDSLSGKKLVAHELTHVLQQQGTNGATIQRQPLSQAQRNQLCYSAGVTQPNPSARHPELHPTYEQWLASFTGMATFTANDTAPGSTARNRFTVLGTEGRPFDDSTATAENESVPTTGRHRSGEEFIDHPTDAWVRNCLPSNLRATAFQLPSDCADIAVILRHVWLAAHHRTETYNGWTVGDNAGHANQRRVRDLIVNVSSGTVHHMVNPYSDAQGRPLRNFNQLSDLLHPGDILVWEHRETISRRGGISARRTGGHVQTIFNIARNGNNITSIDVLQGNQPIFSDAAQAILQHRGATDTNPDSGEGRRLRDLPSRRIERSTAVSDANMTDPVSSDQVWGEVDELNSDGSINEFTVLIAAGPPRSAARPPAQRTGGTRTRSISDWFSRLRTTSLDSLHGVLEAALLEARSIIDGGGLLANSDAEELGTRAGENLWSRATAALRRLIQANRSVSNSDDTGGNVHFDPLHRMRAAIRALGGIQPRIYRGNPSAANNVRNSFSIIDREFNFAARGGSSIEFNRRVRSGGELVKVLVTGFDPFSASPPPPGDWNPAGATAMAMDNTEVDLGSNNKAAIESVIYPVSFAQFREGIVERVVNTANADAVLTISLNPNIASNAPVEIEQFTVGVNRRADLQTHNLFPVEPANPQNLANSTGMRGVPGGGDAILESSADLPGIAADTELQSGNNVVVARPSVESDITFLLPSQAQAQQLLTALGLVNQTASSRRITISDPNAINRIINNSTRVNDNIGATIQITLNSTSFSATILEGPGGSFLSNEVAYRTQRRLQQLASSGNNPAVSFHTHVPPGDVQTIPLNAGSARRRALGSARATVTRLVTTMRRMIRAVGTRIITQRQNSSGGTP